MERTLKINTSSCSYACVLECHNTWDINSECIETFLMGGSECCYGGQMTLKLIHEVLVLDVLKR